MAEKTEFLLKDSALRWKLRAAVHLHTVLSGPHVHGSIGKHDKRTMIDRLMQAKPTNWTASHEPTPWARIVNASHHIIAQSVTLDGKANRRQACAQPHVD